MAPIIIPQQQGCSLSPSTEAQGAGVGVVVRGQDAFGTSEVLLGF